jgi:DNA-binding MarR family transcriptional regulator
MFDIEDSIALRLSNTLNALRKSFNKEIKEFNISSEQYAVLNLINKKEVTPTEISQIFNKDKAAITRFINSLEKKGFVKKKSIDKRSYKLFITEKGKEVLEKVDKKAAKFRKKIDSNISKEEIECLFEVFDKIEKVIKE